MVIIKRVFLYVIFVCLWAGIIIAGQGADSTGTIYNELPGAEFNLFLSTVKVAAALGLTIVLLVAAVWILKRILKFREIPGLTGGAVSILEMHYIAPKKAVALVKVLERILIVGISEQSLNTLGELTPEEIKNLEVGKKPESGVFKNILAGFTGKK